MADKKLRYDIEVDSTAAVRGVEKFDDALEKIDSKKVDVDVDTSQVDKMGGSLDSAADAAGNLPGPLGEIGGLLSGGGGLAAGAGLLATGLFQAANAAADAALEAQSLASLTGDTVTEASRLQAVWKQTGADSNDLSDVLLQMNGTLQQSPELARKLGINLNDGKTAGQRFQQVVGLVNAGLIDATTQSQVFGEEGVRQVANLSTAVSGDLQSALDNVSESQLITDDDVAQAQKMKAEFAEVSASVQGLATQIGQQLIPVLSTMTGLLNTKVGQGSLIEMLGGGSIDHATEMWRQLSGTSDDLHGRLDLTAESMGDVAEATDEVASATDRQADSARRAWSSEDALVSLMGEAYEQAKKLADARRGAADATFALHDDEQQLRDALKDTAKLIKDSPRDLYAQQQALDDVARSAVDVADATVRVYEEQLTANGETITAAQKQDIWRASMVQSAATANGPMADAILGYIGNVEDIPPEKITEIEAAIDRGDLAEAQRLLDEAARTRTATINVQAIGLAALVNQFRSFGYAGSYGPAGTAAAAAPTVIVNQSFPRGMRIDALGEAHRAARRNGRLYQQVGRSRR